MTPAPQPAQQEYIITLSELKRANAFMFTNKLKELSARPHTPAPENKSTCYIHCPTCKQTITTYCNIPRFISQEQAAAIRNAARIDTLKEILEGVEGVTDLAFGFLPVTESINKPVFKRWIEKKIQSLRTPPHFCTSW